MVRDLVHSSGKYAKTRLSPPTLDQEVTVTIGTWCGRSAAGGSSAAASVRSSGASACRRGGRAPSSTPNTSSRNSAPSFAPAAAAPRVELENLLLGEDFLRKLSESRPDNLYKECMSEKPFSGMQFRMLSGPRSHHFPSDPDAQALIKTFCCS